jgi:hypothetical protein
MTNGVRGGAVAWPSGSPDLVLLDVYYVTMLTKKCAAALQQRIEIGSELTF